MAETFWKMPPIEKIPEAYSAIADERIEFDGNSAKVFSSDRASVYHVTWDDADSYASDDNGSKWQNYSGYPIIAVLMLQGKLPLNREIAALFRGVDWKALNKKHKNHYAEALEEFLSSFSPERKIAVQEDMKKVYAALEALQLKRKSSGFSRKAAEKPKQVLTPLPVPQVVSVSDENSLDSLLKRCMDAECTAFLADDRMENFYIAEADAVLKVSADSFSKEKWNGFLKIFFGEKIAKVSHDIKKTMRNLLDRGLPAEGFRFDTALAAYLLDSLAGEYPVKKLAAQYLSLEISDSPEEICRVLGMLADKLGKELERYEMKPLYENAELPLCIVLAEMEYAGVRVDPEMLRQYGKKLESEIARLQEEICQLAGERFNINSTRQLGEILFEKLKLPAGRKTKSGYSTDIEVLESLRGKNPIIGKVIDFRKYSKLKSTYADGLLTEIAPDGRIHTTFQMTATATGRLSSISPNLQNIPIRSELGAELRRMFTASPGTLLVDADYSQIELRILAHIADDPSMRNAFLCGEDIHTTTASQVFGIPPDQVTQEMRRRAKAVNFGIVYGISRFALAADLGVSRAEADDYMNRYFEKYSGIRDYMKKIVEQAKMDGYVKTVFGRRRALPELKSPVFNIRSFGERVALNAPIQGTSADIIKLAMVRVRSRLKRENLKARLILQIHDELIIESPAEEAETVEKLLSEEMCNAVSLSVPLAVEVSSGTDWGNAK